MKEFNADYTDVAPKEGGEGGGGLMAIKDEVTGKRIRYIGKVTEVKPYQSASGNACVNYTLKVVGGKHNGQELKFQNITFLPKEHEYAGIALHFLKCLRVPFEGKFKVKPDEWVGRHVYFFVKHEESTKTDRAGNPYVNNKVAGTEPVDIPTLIELGEYADESEAPEWLREAQAAMDGASKDRGEKKPAKPAADKPAPANGKPSTKGEPKPDTPCDVCDVPYKKHQGKKHEYVEGVPF